MNETATSINPMPSSPSSTTHDVHLHVPPPLIIPIHFCAGEVDRSPIKPYPNLISRVYPIPQMIVIAKNSRYWCPMTPYKTNQAPANLSLMYTSIIYINP